MSRFGPVFLRSARLLGLTPREALDPRKVKQAGRFMARRYHPDTALPEDLESGVTFEDVRGAWDFLSDPDAVAEDARSGSSSRSARSRAAPAAGDTFKVYLGMRFQLFDFVHDGTPMPPPQLRTVGCKLELVERIPVFGVYFGDHAVSGFGNFYFSLALPGHGVVKTYVDAVPMQRSYAGSGLASALWFPALERM